MIQIDTNSASFVLGLLVALAGFIGWNVRLERRFNRTLTRQEHEKICERKHEEIKDAITSLKTSVESKEAYSTSQRHQLREIAQSVEIKVTALTANVQNLQGKTDAIERKMEMLWPLTSRKNE